MVTPLEETPEVQRAWRELVPAPWPEGLSYQQFLSSLNESDGLMLELLFVSHAAMPDTTQWDYKNPDFVEFRMEDIANREEAILRSVF
ncbi:MAG: hypothetical protein AAGJ46_01525 [Planctomycetota bacterium]